MPAVAPSSVDALLDLIRQSNILPPERLAALPGPGSLPPDASAAATELLKRGFITKFQREQLLLGRHKGFRIGPYVIREQLGRGGMGAVYLAEHLDLRRRVAVKILAPGKGEDQKLALERFLREARASASLDHPNIVRTFDVARASQTPYIVMEYVDGETLQHVVDRDGPLPYAVAAEHIAQAAAGLQHAHEKGLVHRDIKPANLMRDRAGVIKLLDLGLARTGCDRDKLTEILDAGAVVGTADYISPEQAMNGTVDRRADIYSLGATFFMLVTGKVPFEGNTTQKLMQHQMRVPPALHEVNAEIPRELSAVVARMLAKKATDRFQSSAEVIAALAPWAAASTRVLAGLSSTALGNAASGTDLSGRAASSSRRLLARASNAEIALGAPEDPEVPTVILSGSVTTMNHPKPPRAPQSAARKRLVVALGGATLAALAVLVGLALSGGKKPDDTTNVPVQPGPQPQPQPQPNAPKPVPQPPQSGKVRFAADFSKAQPFRTHSGLTVDPADPKNKSSKLIQHTGPGALPSGWLALCWDATGEMEVSGGREGDRFALALRNVRAKSAMLFTPAFVCPTGACRVRFEYAGDLKPSAFVLKFKPSDARPAWEASRPDVGGPGWRTFDALVDLKGAPGGIFELHNVDSAAPLRLRTFEVLEPAAPAAQVVYALDAAELPAFRNTKAGFDKTSGDDDPRVPNTYFAAWKKETASAWECGTFAGSKALSLTNVSEVRSAQIGIELEKGRAPLAEGTVVRARVEYRTAGAGRGHIYFQHATDYAVPARTDLPASPNAWKTVELAAARGAEPLRFLVDASTTGTGNALIVRKVTITAGGDTGQQPRAAAPEPKDELAARAEGKSLYRLDADKVPEFRAKKEGGTIASGAENLPEGVWCQVWKPTAVGEFRRGTLDGAAALGVTNLNDEMSGQFGFSLEDGLKLALEPGKAYRLKVNYRTANEATGALNAHVTPGYTSIAYAGLPASTDGWKSAAVSFVRPPASDNVKVRVTIDNTSVGEGNTLWVKSVELVELISPKP